MTTTEIIFATVGVSLTLLGVIATAAQVVVAYYANKQATLAQAAADRQRLSEDKRFALAICEPLATQEVHTILKKPAPTAEEVSFVEALLRLCDFKGKFLLSYAVKGDDTIRDPIDATLAPVREFLENRDVAVDTSGMDSRLRGDRSKYSWDGGGPHSKIWTINLIAQKWAADHQLATVAEFVDSFGKELRTAVPDRADEFDAKWLLTAQTDRHLPSLLLELDGTPYAVHWRCGFKNAQIGVGVHQPVIEHFRTERHYPVAGA